MAISKYDKKFEYGKILTEGDLNGMVDAINLTIDGVNNADSKSETAIKEATTAKNAVKTLEGLANSTEAMETLAGQVVQIEENKKNIEMLSDELVLKIECTLVSDIFSTGRWATSNGKAVPDNVEGYLRSPKLECNQSGAVMYIVDSDNNQVRLASCGLTIKCLSEDNTILSSGWADGSNRLDVPEGTKYIVFHMDESNFANVDGYTIKGIYELEHIPNIYNELKEIKDEIAQISDEVEETKNIVDKISSEANGVNREYTYGDELGVFLFHAYVGDTLGENPKSNTTNHAFGRIDVSNIPDGTFIYITNPSGDDITPIFKYFGADGNRISASTITIDGIKGTEKPEGAIVLGIHIGASYLSEIENKESWMKECVIHNIPFIKEGFIEKMDRLQQEIDELKEMPINQPKRVLMIGSSFSVDTTYELGNIVKSFGEKIIIGNAYIGAATISTFISRYREKAGVTYYKWKYGADAWDTLNGHTGKWESMEDSNITDEGEIKEANDSVLLESILQDEPWDIIILQNGAYQSPYENQSAFWTKDSNGNIVKNYINEMISICEKNCIYSNPIFGVNMTWAFSVYHTISSSHLHDDLWTTYGSTQKERQEGMYRNICQNYKDCLDFCEKIKFVVPSGTAVQNARKNSVIRESSNYYDAPSGMPTIEQAESVTSLDNVSLTYPFMDNYTNWRMKNDLTRDTIHADYGITRFIIAAALYQTILAKFYDKNIKNCTYRILQTEGGNYRKHLCTPVVDSNFADLVKCVEDSIKNPYQATTQ